EIVRADAKTRHLATEGFRAMFENAAPFMQAEDDQSQKETAISVLTNMIGALTIARMVDDPELSQQILEVTRKRVATVFEPPSSKPRDQSAKRAPKAEKKGARSKVQ